MSSRHLFAGSNTPQGFYDRFSYISSLESGEEFYIIKGGAGSGKSTLMKKIGKDAEEKGFDVEYFHCSGDTESLDGVYIPELHWGIADGTFPHVIEPTKLGVCEKILNFSEFLNNERIKKYDGNIETASKKKKEYYMDAYDYLAAANAIYKNALYYFEKSVDKKKREKLLQDIEKLIKENFIKPYNPENKKEKEADIEKYKIRDLFISAITPKGIVNYINSNAFNNEVILLKNSSIETSDFLLREISKTLASKGFKIERYFSPLMPEKIEHIYIEDLKLLIVSTFDYMKVDIVSKYSFDIESILNEQLYNDYGCDIDSNLTIFNMLMNFAVLSLEKAKNEHKLIESCYCPNIDFTKVEKLYEKLSQRIKETK